jgi:hypothetical protein
MRYKFEIKRRPDWGYDLHLYVTDGYASWAERIPGYMVKPFSLGARKHLRMIYRMAFERLYAKGDLQRHLFPEGMMP